MLYFILQKPAIKTQTLGHFTQLKLVWVDFQKKAKWFIRRFLNIIPHSDGMEGEASSLSAVSIWTFNNASEAK